MEIIDEKCPVCGGDVERVDIESAARRPGSSFGGRVTTTYKCLSHPSMGHMPPNWRPGEPAAEG